MCLLAMKGKLFHLGTTFYLYFSLMFLIPAADKIIIFAAMKMNE
jgi:hypothetical protein